jgi:ABC-2 type transport system ATP-binding protein
MAMLCFNDMTTGQPILSTTSLEKAYGDFHAVKGVDLSVSRGEIFGLLGPNGAGKTTVIRMLVGLISASKGEVTYFGELGLRDMQQVLPRIGCIIEEPRFYPYLTGRKNLMLASLYYPKERVKNRIGEVLELVGLTARADDPVKNYSQGMRQRLGIAAAMLHDPELIILDEPTNGLDPQGIIELRQLIIRSQRGDGKNGDPILAHPQRGGADGRQHGHHPSGKMRGAGPCLRTAERRQSASDH